jgi:hypothetical protein
MTYNPIPLALGILKSYHILSMLPTIRSPGDCTWRAIRRAFSNFSPSPSC